MAGRIRIGIGGWTYAPWRGSFYPPGLPQRRELDHASRHLGSIEVNGTYCGSASPDSFHRWHDETPDDFVFSLKGPRFATNRRVLAEAGDSVARFLDCGVLLLGRKLGPINWQFPATKAFDPRDFAAFLDLLPPEARGLRLRHVVELRHASFRDPALLALTRARGIGVVIAADGPHPQIADPTADFIYARIMGTVEGEPLGYAPAALDQWAERARLWASGGLPEWLDCVGEPPPAKARDVFVYVIGGHKQRNPQAAMALIERLSNPIS